MFWKKIFFFLKIRRMFKLALNSSKAVRVSNILNSIIATRSYSVEGLSMSVLNSLNVKEQLKKVKNL